MYIKFTINYNKFVKNIKLSELYNLKINIIKYIPIIIVFTIYIIIIVKLLKKLKKVFLRDLEMIGMLLDLLQNFNILVGF